MITRTTPENPGALASRHPECSRRQSRGMTWLFSIRPAVVLPLLTPAESVKNHTGWLVARDRVGFLDRRRDSTTEPRRRDELANRASGKRHRDPRRAPGLPRHSDSSSQSHLTPRMIARTSPSVLSHNRFAAHPATRVRQLVTAPECSGLARFDHGMPWRLRALSGSV